jgi:hypothetical protein
MPEKPEIVNALTGHLGPDLSPPPGYGFGVSFYVTVWALLESPLSQFQVGLPSAWIKPDNFDFTLPLCPEGTVASHWSERAETFFRDVFQNIEGGVGFWGTTFPTKSPKYRINGVPDCYTTRIGSPGWPFGETNALADQAMGLAQLSNRILVPPDGIPFAVGPEEEHWVPGLLGVAWMALPFTDYDGYFLLQNKKSDDGVKEHGEKPLYLQRGSSGGVYEGLDEKIGPNINQLWTLVPSTQEGYFYLKTKGNDTPADFGGDTLWKLVPTAGEYYYLESNESKNNCLGGDAIVKAASRSSKDETQLWRLVPHAGGDDVATSDSSWTLFLDSENFKGPVAFFPPTTWSRISKKNLPAVGRGLDARMAWSDLGMEFGAVPGLQASYGGKTYLRIPKLLFPTLPHEPHPQLVTPLMQDIMLYSREAIYAAVMSWFANGPEATGQFAATGAIANRFKSPAPIAFNQGAIKGFSDLVEIINLASRGDRPDCSWGLVWKVPPPGSDFFKDAPGQTLKGHFPEYFVNGVAAPASKVPEETGLKTATFTRRDGDHIPPGRDQPYVSPTSGAWKSPGPASEPLTVTLGDGTKVTYAWYRFVDQPALQNLNLTPKQKEQLQSRIKLLHENWSIDRNYIARPPRVISLVSVDPNLIVMPPEGLAVGYVPIVTKQELA